MNYIKQVNHFYKLIQNNPLSANAQCLYNYLLNKDSELGWLEEFTVSNLIICGVTNLSRQALDRARNELSQKGYISYKKGRSNQAGKYLIVDFVTQDDTQDVTQSDTQGGHTVSTLNKLKQNKNNNEQKKILLEHFEKIWNIYPRKKGKAKAQELYLQWVNGRKISDVTRKLTDKQMYYAVLKYAKECEKGQIEQQFIKHGDTFFNKAILDYVEEENE